MHKPNAKINPLVCQNYHFLKTLAKTKSKEKRNKLLKNLTTEQLLVITEICLNIVKSRFELKTKQKKRMLPFADIIRKIARARSEKTARRLVQKGNGISPFIFSALLSPIISEISKLLKSNVDQ